MELFLKEINAQEKSQRIALSKKYPILLPVILESKRLARSLLYKLDPRFRLKMSKERKDGIWNNLTAHSSPLFRKYNKRELDLGKIENIKIAIKKLDGIIIPPGRVFSFWKNVGRPAIRKGFKRGLVISDGRLKEDIGGGLCQLSNLLAYMFACTECAFVERKHHSRDVFPDYNRTVPFASGATVFFNLIDLKVRNTYSFPIKISLRMTDTQLRGSLSSTQKLSYYIKLEEKKSYFIKSEKTENIYRCNSLFRVYYEKNSKRKIGEIPLWRNVARVMYDEGNIKSPILWTIPNHS